MFLTGNQSLRDLPLAEGQSFTSFSVMPGKKTVLVVGDVRMSIEYPANVELPDSVMRLVKGLARKLEEWAKETA